MCAGACLQMGTFPGSCSDPRLLLAIPVVEMVGAAQHVVLVAGPDPHLVAVRVLGDAELVLRREKRDAHDAVARVAHEMGAVRAGREADGVARSEHALPL